jgi:hypothetical protein
MATKKSTAKGAKAPQNAPQVVQSLEGERVVLGTPEVAGSAQLSVEPIGDDRWTVRIVGESNPFLASVSSGYTSQEEAVAAATALLRTKRPVPPKGEPRPIWLDETGNWTIGRARDLWPLAPGVVLVDLRWVGAGEAPDGDGLVVAAWERADRATKSLVSAALDGAQPRVSIVERRLIPTAIAFTIRVEHGKLAL